jgi:hypothetical protein
MIIAAVYGNLIRGPSGAIGLGKGLLVSLVAAIVGFLIALLFGLAAGVVIAGA